MAVIPNCEERNDFKVGTFVSYDVMKELYEIAEKENVTVNRVIRKFIEKGVNDYGRK